MDQKIIVEYNKLLSEFDGISKSHKKRIIVGLRRIFASEEYRYLKYERLRRMMLINRAMLNPAMDASVRMYHLGKINHAIAGYDLAEQLIKESEIPEEKPPKSHFRSQK